MSSTLGLCEAVLLTGNQAGGTVGRPGSDIESTQGVERDGCCGTDHPLPGMLKKVLATGR